ncbi:MAG: DNA polymerase III subunit gamma/tau [Chloroflexi bacterium]|nr:MAG: DNA polymerase III subunit gamma/tau [Chloroflexota bacterium]
MGQALYRKWRPQTFEDVVEQKPIVRTLRNALRLGRIHHAYLFAGPRGTGKTTLARLLAKAVNCLAPVEERPCNQCEICQALNAGRLMDLIEIDAASNTGVDNVRDLLEKVGFRPTQARYKVYVIDEAHMLSTAAFNALLKTLEEPPAHVIFILATTEAHKIPATVISRCQRFEFSRIPLDAIVQRLQKVSASEGIQTEPEALDLIARAATGSLRDAISLLDQLTTGNVVTADSVRLMLGAERREVVQALAQSWTEGDLNGGLRTIQRAVDGGADPRQLARQLADFLRGLLLMRLGAGESWSEPTSEERPRFTELARRLEPERLVAAVRLFSQVAQERHAGWQPQLPLELAFVEATLPPTAPAPPTDDGSRVQPAQPPRSDTPARNVTPAPAASPATATFPPKTDQKTPRPSADLVAAMTGRWREVSQEMKAGNLALSALLNDARPLDIDGEGCVVLGFKHSFHRNKVDVEANRQAVEDLLSRMFRQPLRVRCVLTKEWTPSPQSAPTPPPKPPAPPDDPLAGDEVIQRAVQELGAVPKVIEEMTNDK